MTFEVENFQVMMNVDYIRGVRAGLAGWARAHPLSCLIFSEKECLPTHYLRPIERFLVLPTHFEEASDAPVQDIKKSFEDVHLEVKIY